MFLSRSEIYKEIEKGNIKIEPFNKKLVGPISVDLTLGDEFGILLKKYIRLTKNVDYKKYVKIKKLKKIVLNPGDFVLGITKEKITLSENIAGFLSSRSRYARFGILVHATAPLIHPGVSNKQVFEIKNISNAKIELRPGLHIGQVSFIRIVGKAKYNGAFKFQEHIK